MAKVLITGANRGIGLEFCRQLVARGDTVLATCRKASDELQALDVEVIDQIDVTNDSSLDRLSDQIGSRTLDVLVNNAGIMERTDLDNFDEAAIRRQFEVNALGPMRTTRALLDRIPRGGRVAMITSKMGSCADNGSGGQYGYRMSKAALNIASVSMARDLADRGISIAILHPGWVQTDMTSGSGNLTASESVQGLIARIDELHAGSSGQFKLHSGETLPW